MLAILFILCFAAVYGIDKLTEGQWPMTSSITLVVANIAASMKIRSLVLTERHDTKTERDLAIMVKLSLFYAMTYTAIPTLIHWSSGTDWYSSDGLISEQWSLMLINGIFLPLTILCDLPGRIKRCTSRLYNPARMPGVNQLTYQKLLEPPDIDAARVYAKVFKTLLLGLWFSPVLPVGLPITAFALAFEFWAYKYQLLRNSKRPYRQGHEVGYGALRLMFFGVGGFACAQRFFLTPSLTGDGLSLVASYNWPIILFVSLVMLLAPSYLWQLLMCACLCQRVEKDTSTDDDYYVAQKAWPKHHKYQTTSLVHLQLESLMVKEVQQRLHGAKLRWDTKTGNFPDPSGRVVTDDGDLAAGSPGAGLLTAATPVTDGGAVAGAVGADAVLLAHPGPPEAAMEEGSDESADIVPEETATMAEVDPMALAFEEEKVKGLAALALGGETEDEEETDDSADGSSEEDEGDEEAPVATTIIPSGSALAPGSRAQVSGLTSAAGVTFNGTICTLQRLTGDGDKWVVFMENGKYANVPTSCLTVLPAGAGASVESSGRGQIRVGMKVKIAGLSQASQYNGTVATVVAWDAAANKWQVKLFTGNIARIPNGKLRPVEGG
jgi:hypothetical protein